MRTAFPFALAFPVAATLVFAQPSTPVRIQVGGAQVGPPGAAPAASIPDSHVVAKVDGQPITAGKLREMLQGAPQQAILAINTDPKEFLTWLYTMKKMAAQAEKEGLDKKSPYADRLHWTDHQVLMMGMIETQREKFSPTEAEAKAWYESNTHLHGTAKAKLIYVAPEGGSAPGAMDKARTKAEALAARARKGEPFGKLAKENSDDPKSAAQDGDMPTVHPGDKLPAEIKKKIFAAKPNEVIGPFERPTGFYVFQVLAAGAPPLDESTSKDLVEKLRETRMQEWMDSQRKATGVKLLNNDFFQGLAAKEMFGQAQAEVKPETELATVNGKTVTAERFTNLLKGVSPQIRGNAVRMPSDFLGQYAFMQRLTDTARQTGLDKKQPYLGRLTYNRDEILTQALVDRYNNEIAIGVEEQRKGYDSNPDRFRWAKVRVLYISYSLTPPPRTDPNAPKILNEEESRQKADEIAKQIRAGTDFTQMVQQHSEDIQTKQKGGEIPLVVFDSPGPAEIKTAIFAAKPGELVGPIKMPNGFWLIKVDDLGQKKYEEVKDQVYEELRAERFKQWFDGERGKFQVEIADANAIRQVAGPPASAPR